MKNKDIITLVNSGFLLATAHSLPGEEFYKWYKFRRFVTNKLQSLADEQKAILEELNLKPDDKIEDPALRKQYEDCYNKMMNEEITFELPEKIPFEFYKALYDENKTESADIFANITVENLMLDNLFTE